MSLLETRRLKKYFSLQNAILPRNRATVKAVDGVDLSIKQGETLGLVGESCCGKSTFGRLCLRLLDPSGGEVYFGGEDISHCQAEQMRQLRRKMQIIFQDPYSALNPRMKVLDAIKAPLDAFGEGSRKDRKEQVAQIMERVGLRQDQIYRFPHEFSGGQRQRIVIARALVLKPSFVVCDEPVSALDVSVRSQVINLMRKLQRDFSLTYLFISHDLSLIKHVSDRVAVMYLGRIVELAAKDELFKHTLHPYTQALMSAIPIPDAEVKPQPILLKGETPSPISLPPGCRFSARCPQQTGICVEEEPVLRDMGGGHFAACHLCTAGVL